MILFTLIVIICAAIGAFLMYDGWIEEIFLGGIIGALCGLIPAAIIVIMLAVPLTTTESRKTPIAALGDGSSISGRFYLGSGTIDEKMVFNYYADNGGSYSLMQAGAEISSIVEDDGKYVETSVKVTPSRWYTFGMETVTHVTFHVPKNSVKNNYILDAQ